MVQSLSGVEVLVVVLAAACLVLTSVVVALAVRVSRLSGSSVAGGRTEGDAAWRRELRGISEQVARVESGLGDLRGSVGSTIRHVGVVRYDAFRDMGGHMSFSLALLDSRRNGVVLSILNGRDGSRGYAKVVDGGQSASPLSEEEQAALSQALGLAHVR